MQELKHRELSCRSVDTSRRAASFVASTDTLDSYGESVLQNWRLDRYKRNPVVLYNHQRLGTDLPIGTATVAIVGGRLECEITFVTAEANPLAELVWQSVKQRSLRAVSVGFRPHTTRAEVRDGEEVWVLDDNELYEISVTPLPANPEALAKTKALAAIEERAAAARERGADLGALVAVVDDDDGDDDLEALMVHPSAREVAAAEPTRGTLATATGADLAALVDDDDNDGDAPDLGDLVNDEGGEAA